MNTKNRLIKAFRERRWADLFKGKHYNRGIKITKWYSSKFTARYWAKHYVVHISSSMDTENIKYLSGTYDLSMIYLTQFEYKDNEIKKLKKLIRRFIQNYLYSNLLDSFIDKISVQTQFKIHNSQLVHQFVRENILFAYILGLVDFTDTELEEIENKILDKDVEIRIDIYDDAFYIFPYFTLLFQNSFEDKKIKVSKENIKKLRAFFINQNTITIIKYFISFCKQYEFGIYQMKKRHENIEVGSEEYLKLFNFISTNNINFFDLDVNENMFNSLLPNLKRIKNSYIRTKTELYLNRQNLTQFPRNLNPNIIALDLEDNKIEVIENIEHLKRLSYINLRGNPIKKITRSAYEFLKSKNIEISISDLNAFSPITIDNLEIIENVEKKTFFFHQIFSKNI